MTRIPRICSVEKCDRKRFGRGYCQAHYLRHMRGSDLNAPIKPQRVAYWCSVEGCDRPHKARGLCGLHHARLLRGASLEDPKQRQDGSRRCEVRECERGHVSSGFCGRHYHAFKKYRLTPQEMFERDTATCQICGSHPEGGVVLSVDHDHSCCPGEETCGKCVRGFLCVNCNRGLGCFKDRDDVLKKAWGYLQARTSDVC